ncbi:Transmembrane protein [Yarrowia sp. C11]|nr:Transmembrane protein [Yarrowia sp. E02]KAG5372792.1 Transmembrane protein [Yarrowia sp. C11]
MYFKTLDTINAAVAPINIDIDRYLKVIFPFNIVTHIPDPVKHVLGGRSPDQPKQAPPSMLLKSWWTLFNSFAGLIVAGATVKYGSYFVNGRHVPGLAPSCGATAILIYNALEAPLAQPRNVFVGTVISSIIGVGICKLFMLGDNEDYLWISGSLAVGIASVVMSLTKTIHPPAGAAALLASITPDFRHLGWKYIVVQVISMSLMLAVACLLNNIQMRYPMYWLYPGPAKAPVAAPEPEKKPEEPPKSEPTSETDETTLTVSAVGVNSPIELTEAEQLVLAGIQRRLADALP